MEEKYMRKKGFKKTQLASLLALSMTAGSVFPAFAAPDSVSAATGFTALAEAEDYTLATASELSTPSQAPRRLARSIATGDLWENWLGAELSWEGEGTRENPYKITGMAELMGLSEAVAQGQSFAGRYFELQSDIDMGDLGFNDGSWNPIGWYNNTADLDGMPHPFCGSFDGGGHTIFGLNFHKTDYDYSYLGLFGYLKNATVKNLHIEAGELSGADKVGILAGLIEGNSKLEHVTVSGDAYGNGDLGGIAGMLRGGDGVVTVENCSADSVSLHASGSGSYTGGIAGNAQHANIVDVSVSTMDGDSDRIQGRGYVGGIVGRQAGTNIYNSYVTGTIGGNGTLAVGGISGRYESGNIIVAQMDAEIGRSNHGVAAHEGSIIGTRAQGNGFRYGSGRSDNLSYLYLGQAAQTKTLVGSGIADDNIWTMDAHIGYYTDYQRKYVQVAGTRERGSGERFFYEELEDGIKYIITQKLGRTLTVDYAAGTPFKLDHFAPGNQGEPVLGYLVSIPRIDTRNANGTFDNDVAVLTAISSTNNSFYRRIDKDTPSAVAPGCTVTVATAAKNRGENRYQLVYDENEPGRVKPPTYTDEDGEPQDMSYASGGAYSFVMPEADTELNAAYVKVTTRLAMTPAETRIAVTQTRSGDRKNPKIITEVRNEEGGLIAKYINGARDTSVQVLPVALHAAHNGEGAAADETVSWSIDDTDLLHFEDGWRGGYTAEDAKIVPNIQSDFIQGIINREVRAQADGRYQQPIRGTIYTDSAVVTAATNPETSTDNKAVTGTCKVNVSFQIIDQTTLRVEGLALNQNNISFTVTRQLSGDRKHPTERYIVTEPISLDASLNPSQPFYKNVSWTDLEAGKIISLRPAGTNQQSCAVSVVYNANGQDNPAWIQNIINADNSRRAADGGYARLTGSGSMTELVTATSEDQTHGIVSTECQVSINFVTDDQTVIQPEGLRLSKTNAAYELHYQYSGDIHSNITAKTGFGERDRLTATVLPDISADESHEPYNRNVRWVSSEPEALSVLDGRLMVNDGAAWLKEALSKAPYSAQKSVTVTAMTEDGEKAASCEVLLRFKASVLEADRDSEHFELVLTKTGRRSRPVLSWSGHEARRLGAAIYGSEQPELTWHSADSSVLRVDADGVIRPIITDETGKITAEWITEAMKRYPYKGQTSTVVSVSSADGSMRDSIPVSLSFRLVDRQYSEGGGSSSGGGSASGSSATGGSAALGGLVPGSKPGSGQAAAAAPQGSVSGSWSRNVAGKWLFTGAGRSFANEWAYIYNPYAAAGQRTVDWFRFDASGFMVTGWFKDSDGHSYYLHPVSDNTLGHMYTGWHWIDDDGDGVAECYFFNPVAGGPLGSLLKQTTTVDGYQVNEKGQWTVGGIVQTRKVR